MKVIDLWRKSFLVQIASTFSVLSFGGITLVGGITVVQARASLTQSVFERLSTVASLKEGEIDRWLRNQRNTLASLNDISEIKKATTRLLTTEQSSSVYAESLETLQTSFGSFIRENSDYREIFIVSRSSRVLVSTTSGNIGQYRPGEHSNEIKNDTNNVTFISTFYESPETRLPTVTISSPILDSQGNLMATLSAHINLDRIDEITGDIQDIDQTYLVTDIGNSFAEKYVFASAKQFEAHDFPEGLNSPGIT
ncbi:MAG: cache domain-containing protein, partial [Cyanobacteria bacterium P01_F01_bin.150]